MSKPLPDPNSAETLDGGLPRTVGGGSGSSPDNEATPGKRLGPYEIISEIGRGGMGVVYKALHPGLKRTVALKVLIAGEDASEEAVARFQREAEAVAKLGLHPNLVPVYDIGAQGKTHYIAMHFVEGKPLDALIDDGEIAPKGAARTALKIARALQHAHSHGILHRDIKPSNVLVDTAGEPLVTDFGLAKDIESGSKMTRSGMTLGTPSYMPPEQADGRTHEIDERSDVYSLGATLYEMLAGAPPFDGSGVADVLYKVLTRDPKPLRRANPAIARDLETICLTCLEKAPRRRYQSAEALADDLERFLSGDPIAARPPSALEKLARRIRRNKAASAAILATVLALAAGSIAAGLLAGNAAREADSRRRAQKEADDASRSEEKALSQKDEAEANLKRTQQANRVLRTAFAKLGRAQVELKKAFFQTQTDTKRRRAVLDSFSGDIEAFMESTPDDPASRAAAHAVRGWLLVLGTRQDEGFAELQKARDTDRRVVWGYLFEAMIWLVSYVFGQPPPQMEFSFTSGMSNDRRVAKEALPESREKFEALLAQAQKECDLDLESAEDFRLVFQGFSGLQSGDVAASRTALTRALALGDLAWIEEELLLARAKLGLAAGNYDEGVADVDRILSRVERNPELFLLLASLHKAKASVEAARGEDPSASLMAALGALERGLIAYPRSKDMALGHATIRLYRAFLKAKTGADPSGDYERAGATLDSILEAYPDDVETLRTAGYLRYQQAKLVMSRGQDQGKFLSEGAALFRRALGVAPESAKDAISLAVVLSELGDYQASKGQDASPALRESEALLDRAVATGENGAVARTTRGYTLHHLARFLHRRGMDPWPALEKGLEDARFAVAAGLDEPDPYLLLGNMLFLRTQVRGRKGEGIREDLMEAEAAFNLVLARPSPNPLHFHNRGNVRIAMAEPLIDSDQEAGILVLGALADFKATAAAGCESATLQDSLGVAHLLLAKVRALRGEDPDEALMECIEVIEDLVDKAPRACMNATFGTQALECFGRFSDAAELLQKVLTAKRVDERLKKALYRQAEIAGHPAWARLVYQAAARVRLNDYRRAKKLYEQALEAAPESAETDLPNGGNLLGQTHYNLTCFASLEARGGLARLAPVARVPEAEAAKLLQKALGHLVAAVALDPENLKNCKDDPDLAPVRALPGYAELVDGRMGRDR